MTPAEPVSLRTIFWQVIQSCTLECSSHDLGGRRLLGRWRGRQTQAGPLKELSPPRGVRYDVLRAKA
eukprot:1018576-Amphidinium_carterae.1